MVRVPVWVHRLRVDVQRGHARSLSVEGEILRLLGREGFQGAEGVSAFLDFGFRNRLGALGGISEGVRALFLESIWGGVVVF